jgi:hypothetical protein
MKVSKKIFLLNLFLLNCGQIIAIDLKDSIGLSALLAVAQGRVYHFRNASPTKIIKVEYTCPDHTNKASSMIGGWQQLTEQYLDMSPLVAAKTSPSKAPSTETKYDITLWPGDASTVSKCDRIDSVRGVVQAGSSSSMYSDASYYAASPTYNTLYTYRTFKVDTGNCKHGHWCHTYDYDKTSIFGRDFGVAHDAINSAASNITAGFGEYNNTVVDLMQNSTATKIEGSRNLRRIIDTEKRK